jgi:hypothetical protein
MFVCSFTIRELDKQPVSEDGENVISFPEFEENNRFIIVYV